MHLFSAWIVPSAFLLLTPLLAPQPVAGLTTANFATNIFRELRGLVGRTHHGLNQATYSTFNTDNLETPAAFWERAFSLGRLVQDYATSLVRDAAAKAEPQVAAQINSAYNTMHMVVVEAGGLKNAFADLRAGASFNDIQNDIEMVLTDLLEELKEQFPAPDRAPNHAERRGNVSLVLEKVEEALIDLGTVVTWAQSKFYGGFIPKGSWFSALQRAAMKTGRWADPVQTIGGSIAVGAGIAGSMFAGCGR